MSTGTLSLSLVLLHIYNNTLERIIYALYIYVYSYVIHIPFELDVIEKFIFK